MLQHLLDRQKQLDHYIIKTKCPGINPEVRLTNTILALQVEVCELANELRCFKHWSAKGPSEREVIVEEYIDVLHFMLSLANQLGMDANEIVTEYNAKNQKNYDRANSAY